jgi:hypothetical protein
MFHFKTPNKMKTSFYKLLLSLAFLFAVSLSSSAQVGSITVKWNDDCYPAVSNTDHFYITLSVYRNIDGAQLCHIIDNPHNEAYNATQSVWYLPTCNCADVVGGYHIIAVVQRINQYGTLICEGTTEINRSCSELTDLEVKVEMPS